MIKLFILMLLAGVTSLSYAQNFVVKVDGTEVGEKSEYTFNRDETYRLDVEGLKPKSVVYVRYKKAGIKMEEVRAWADDQGMLMRLLEAPEKSIGATCEIEFTTADNVTRMVKFRIKFRNLEKGNAPEPAEESDSK